MSTLHTTKLNKVSESYYQSSRPELVDLVPISAERVLELGCGEGRTGAAIRQRQRAFVTGIELEPDIAGIATTSLNDVRQADLDSFDFPWEEASFDCIIAADIVEHLRDPWRVLRESYRLLARHGVIIVSIPNISFSGIISNLMSGRFDYRDTGLLDRTHLRFFTRATFAEALLDAGFILAKTESIFVDPGLEERLHNSSPTGTLDLGKGTIQYESHEELRDILTYQWIMVGMKTS